MDSSTPDRHTRRRLSLRERPRLTGDRLTPAQVDRLLAKIQETDTGCWLWTATRNAAGYGVLVWATKCYAPHRLLYEWYTAAPVPQDLEIDHLCRNRACCNPAHLEACTKSENLRRRYARDARPLFDWRSARDASVRVAHIKSITKEGGV